MPSWNLTEPLSTSTVRRFHLPVASDPTGGAALPSVPPARYHIEEMEVDGMPRLQLTVPATAEGFAAEGGLPAAVIRLHAMGTGCLSYRPQVGSLRNCLLLDLVPQWLTMAVIVNWLYRWLEADCIPRTVIYDNVDAEALHAFLDALPPAQADATPADSLSFPRSVRRQGDSQAWFIDRFMAGEPDAEMFAWRGACIGQMGTVAGSTSRRLGLTMRYQGHSDVTPRPMMPRELFNLLFGIDSAEFDHHPLLHAIQQVGESQTSQPVSRRMLLRPPLRTSARVVWEATQELPDAARWSMGGRLDDTKLLNIVDDFDRQKEYGPDDDPVNHPGGLYKCQVFGFEMLLRSGFRVRMHRYEKGGRVHLYYYRVNRLARDARDVEGMTPTEPGLIGKANEFPWGRRWDLVLVALPPQLQAVELNRMIEEEGRAFYLLREFEGKPGNKRSGHFLLLERMDETVPPDWRLPAFPYTIAWERRGSTAPGRGTAIGLHWISGMVIQAPAGGLQRGVDLVLPQWPNTAKPAVRHLASFDNDLLLIEALPGPDPHTLDGVRALCSIHERED